MNFLKIWSAESFEIESSMTPEEALNKLHGHIEPKKNPWSCSRPTKYGYFIGEISGNNFRISGLIDSDGDRSGCRLSGIITPKNSGSSIKINIEPPDMITKIFIVIWLSFFPALFLGCLAGMECTPNDHTTWTISTFAMVTAGFLFFKFALWSGVKQTKTKLIDIFTKPSSVLLETSHCQNFSL